MSKFSVITDHIEALRVIGGTSLKGHLDGYSYFELEQLLGTPVFSKASGDDKVQKEWVVQYGVDFFTIYDWKTYSEQYTVHQNQEWNVGGKFDANEFIEYLEGKLELQRNENDLEQFSADQALFI